MTSKMLTLHSCVVVLTVSVACGRSPVAPSSQVLATEPTAEGTSAKAPGGAPHVVVSSGGISGTGSLVGSITGDEGGTLRAQAKGYYEWTIGPLLNGGYCEGNGATIIDAGLVGNALSGSLTIDANQRTSFGERLSLAMTGVVAPDTGDTWEIRADTVGYPVDIGGSPAGVTVDVPATVIGFTRMAKGRAASTVRCAVGFVTAIAPQ